MNETIYGVFDISSWDGEPCLCALYKSKQLARAHVATLEEDRAQCKIVDFPLIPRFYRPATADEISLGLAAGIPII